MAEEHWAQSGIRMEIDQGLAQLVLNRPDVGNKLDGEMAHALSAAAGWLSTRKFRALLLRAEGPRFCVGGAIDAFDEQLRTGRSLDELLASGLPEFHNFIRFIHGLGQPVVSAVQGSVGGGGIGLALCADIVLASEDMKLRGGYLALGLTPDLGSSWHLTRLAGPQKTAEILMSNRFYTAPECLEMGLITALVPVGALTERALELARMLANGPSGAYARVKSLIAHAATADLASHLDLEERLMRECAASTEAREGINAFLEKRAPHFTA